ncbi:hypothetical protein ABPG72_012398 [Tetrahymena utriculariae]
MIITKLDQLNSIQTTAGVNSLKMLFNEQLVGENHTNKMCQLLKEAQNLNYLKIDIKKQIQFGDIIAKMLGQSISNCKNLQNLNLIFINDNISNEGSLHISRGISECKNLTEVNLYLGYNLIGDNHSACIGQGLANCKKLTNLTIDLTKNNVFDDSVGFGQQIAKLDNLTYLNLSFWRCQNLQEVGSTKIAQGIAQCKNLNTLIFDLSSTAVGQEGPSNFLHEISKSQTISNLTLRLKNNELDDNSTEKIGLSLLECKRFHYLALDLSQFISNISNYCNSFVNFNSINNIGPQGAFNLSKSLGQCVSLQSLKLSFERNGIHPEGAKSFGEQISKSKNLKNLFLDFSENPIGKDGTLNLVNAITQTPKLSFLKLRFWQNEIGNELLEKIGEAASQIQNLCSLHLDLKQTHIGEKGCQRLVNQLRKCKQLSALQLQLGGNNIPFKKGQKLGFEYNCLKISNLFRLDIKSI